MFCLNCGATAVWVFATPGVKDRPYCNIHLPAAYRGTSNAKPITPEVMTEVAQEKPAPTAKSAIPESVPVSIEAVSPDAKPEAVVEDDAPDEK